MSSDKKQEVAAAAPAKVKHTLAAVRCLSCPVYTYKKRAYVGLSGRRLWRHVPRRRWSAPRHDQGAPADVQRVQRLWRRRGQDVPEGGHHGLLQGTNKHTPSFFTLTVWRLNKRACWLPCSVSRPCTPCASSATALGRSCSASLRTSRCATPISFQMCDSIQCSSTCTKSVLPAASRPCSRRPS